MSISKVLSRIKYLFLFIIVIGCVEPYAPAEIRTNSNLLVVDGFLNSTTKYALVRLSRTLKLTEEAAFPREKDAVVNIEDENGAVYPLTETSDGRYENFAVMMNAGTKCRLHIQTTNGKEYRSDYIMLKQSPPIESISWQADGSGVQLYVDAHDPSGNTNYYQWLYTETWEYRSNYTSLYHLIDGTAVPRLEKESINTCWQTGVSPRVLTASTVKLSEDRVNKFPLTFIPARDSRLLIRYSITVEQRALNKETFEFLSKLQSAENVGGLFDPQANPVTGNVFNMKDIHEPVLGYFNAGSAIKKRIFIARNELPDALQYNPVSSCSAIAIPLNKLKDYSNSTLLIAGYGDTQLEGYLTSTAECIDCRTHGGTTSKPFFWP